MWKYEKKLQYPVNIKNKDLNMAKALLAQYGGPDGEFAAAMRYLNQRYTMPDEKGYALLNDIGTEELAHVEMIAAMVGQLMKGASPNELKAAGLTPQYVEHDHALFPVDAFGVPYTSAYIEASGDWNADLISDMAAEQRARITYEHLMDLTNDPDLLAPLSFLRQREVVHYNRFKQLRNYYAKMFKESKNV
ncbi:MAG: manganese catalase family protein [bacterium]|nr:manganese catalase family protein [bacterium]